MRRLALCFERRALAFACAAAAAAVAFASSASSAEVVVVESRRRRLGGGRRVGAGCRGECDLVEGAREGVEEAVASKEKDVFSLQQELLASKDQSASLSSEVSRLEEAAVGSCSASLSCLPSSLKVFQEIQN